MAKLKKLERHVLVCEHKDCEKRGGRDVQKALKGALRESGRRESVMVSRVDCFDRCGDGPVVVVYPDGVWYGRVDERGAREIVERHLCGGGLAASCEVLRDLRAAPGGE